MFKKLLSCLLIVVLAVSLAFSAGAVYTFGRGCDSDAKPEYNGIAQMYNLIYDNYGVEAQFVNATELSGEGSARDYCMQYVSALGEEGDRIVFVRTRDDASVYTSGKCAQVFTSDVVDSLYDVCVAEGDDTIMMAVQFFANVNLTLGRNNLQDSEILNASQTDEQAQADEETDDAELPEDTTIIEFSPDEASDDTITIGASPASKSKSLVKPIVICVVIGLLIALLVTLSVKSSYKPVRRKSDAAEYLVDGSLHVTNATESFVRKDVSERKIQSGNSSDPKS